MPVPPCSTLDRGLAIPDAANLERREVAVPASALEVMSVPSAVARSEGRTVWPNAVVALYAAGMLFLLSRLLLGWHSMSRLVGASAPVRLEGRNCQSLQPFAAPVYESGGVASPLTAGISSPRIILPLTWRNWPADKLCAVLAHEFAYAQEIRKKLDESQDGELLAAAGEYLENARRLYQDRKIDFDPTPLAKSYPERALQLNPQSNLARMRVIGLRAGERSIRMWGILRNVPSDDPSHVRREKDNKPDPA